MLFPLCLAATLASGPPPAVPPGRRAALTDGRLFVPEGYRMPAAGVTLVLHLHGASWAVERSLARAGLPGITVQLPGLSRVYMERFRDPAVFPRILAEAMRRIQPKGGAEPRRVIVTSFSAGFGGVRELLRRTADFDRIDSLVMADSIHAGFDGDAGGRLPDPAHMEGFSRFAGEAAAGRKRLVVSHSEIRPDSYASTTETADYLLRAVETARDAVDEQWPGGLRLATRARKGGLAVYGFRGEEAADHMRHLHELWVLMEKLDQP